MSSFATPMIHTTAATVNPSALVNPERCVAVQKQDRPGGRPADDLTYTIEFIYDDRAENQSITWAYATEAARDADFTVLVAAISTAI